MAIEMMDDEERVRKGLGKEYAGQRSKIKPRRRGHLVVRQAPIRSARSVKHQGRTLSTCQGTPITLPTLHNNSWTQRRCGNLSWFLLTFDFFVRGVGGRTLTYDMLKLEEEDGKTRDSELLRHKFGPG
jgi:hypothetical protein